MHTAIDSFQLFEEANTIIYSIGNCVGPALDEFIIRKKAELLVIEEEEQKRNFVLEYIDLIGLELHGFKNFSSEVLRQINARYN